jgi:hypothetical protein
MAVNQVVVQAVTSAEILKASGKIGEMRIYGQLVYFFILARPEMNEAGILSQFIYYLILGVVNSGIYINPMPQLAQLTCQFQDVDAHAASVFGAQLTHRTAVRTEHGNLE